MELNMIHQNMMDNFWIGTILLLVHQLIGVWFSSHDASLEDGVGQQVKHVTSRST